ncbi:MAG: Radical domain protein [Anaerocolumna sp.]|jgi:radical SAM superfamily enzyme YgiQ (UPF0313 family)|nr:Radical domain protein [Anaerocolumna sp.]
MSKNKLKIALIHPDYNNKVYETLSAPLGLCWISSSLKEINDFDVYCYDFAKDIELILTFKVKEYDIICIQLHSQETLKENLLYISQIKSENPDVTIVVGGIASELNTNYIITRDYIDILCLGEGEDTLPELCLALYNNKDLSSVKGILYKTINNDIIHTGLREISVNIDSLPLPDREGFGIDYPQWSIITARGCPFDCRFCSVPQICKNKVRYRDINKVYEEIRFLHDTYNMKKFFILDDTFTINKKRTIELCELLTNLKDIEWTCVTRADMIDEEMLTKMKSAGCIQISCGIESANNDIQSIINKNLNIDKVLLNLKNAKKIGLRVRCSFIFGLPGEEEKHIKKSIKFMCDLMPNEVQIYPYVPYNETEIFKEPEKYGLDLNSYHFLDKKDLFSPFIETKLLKREKLKELSELCIKKLKLKGYLWIPGDVPAIKQSLEYVVMTEFAPVQTLC